MHRISGNVPEALPSAEDINDVRKGLRAARKEFVKLDKPKKRS